MLGSTFTKHSYGLTRKKLQNAIIELLSKKADVSAKTIYEELHAIGKICSLQLWRAKSEDYFEQVPHVWFHLVNSERENELLRALRRLGRIFILVSQVKGPEES